MPTIRSTIAWKYLFHCTCCWLNYTSRVKTITVSPDTSKFTTFVHVQESQTTLNLNSREAEWCVWMSHLSPIWELIQPEKWHRVTVDRHDEGDHADQVHHKARLHHVRRLHAAVTKHDGVRCCGYRQGKGIGADYSWNKMKFLYSWKIIVFGWGELKAHQLAGWGKLGWCTWWSPSWPRLARERSLSPCLTPRWLSSPARYFIVMAKDQRHGKYFSENLTFFKSKQQDTLTR